MPLLYSNYPPLRRPRRESYQEVFYNLLGRSDTLYIASGYISNDSLIDLKTAVEANSGPRIELCIGMHYFEGLTRAQKIAVETLDKFLQENDLGGVYFVINYPFHGKVAAFSVKDDMKGVLIGSSNLSSIVPGHRQYEVDYKIENNEEAEEARAFLHDLVEQASAPYSALDDIPIIEARNSLLEGQYGVESVDSKDIESAKSRLSNEISFEIPLKTSGALKSNLNPFFGKGRENSQGYVVPRPWYEVELIVSRKITSQPGYPRAENNDQDNVFPVITDDGWQFKCKVSKGSNSKNFRSDDDLKILGKWIKGRLENAGVLEPGELVTKEVLDLYGRNSLTLTKIEGSDYWYLDFGVNE